MKILLAGASGAVGRRLTPMLVAGGHDVTGTSTTAAGARRVQDLGGRGRILDALDAASVDEVVTATRPEVIISMLTSLAGVTLSPRRFDAQFAVTNRLRTEGTRHLLEAGRSVGTRRLVVQSYTGWTNPRTSSIPATEDEGLDDLPARQSRRTRAAIAEQERLVTEAEGIEGIALRFGLLYGPGTALAPGGEMAIALAGRRLPVVGPGTAQWSFVHVDDAAAATTLALRHGRAGVYNVVDDVPLFVREWLPSLADALGAPQPRHLPTWLARPLIGEMGIVLMLRSRGSDNARARRELGWEPAHPDARVGFRLGRE